MGFAESLRCLDSYILLLVFRSGILGRIMVNLYQPTGSERQYFSNGYTANILNAMKRLIKKLGYTPKDNSIGIYQKCYSQANDYCIEIDFENKSFNYGELITAESKTTLNFSQKENWVVLECVNRLLEKGYKPEDIILEKTFPSGHGHSGRLDILVKKDKDAFLMIECKTYGKEYDKELGKINKKGGQLFTYFQNDTNAEFLMLYSSSLINENIVYKNEIIKIEDNYRTAGNVEDVFSRWNKICVQNGIFEQWVEAYHFQNKRLIKKELKPLNESDSGFIFHGFLSILRKHSVSDKPNAFNKIFNLFLAKLFDEKKRPNDELDFQWRENKDNPVVFQIRLISLYQAGMLSFLEKEVVSITDEDFEDIPPEKLLAQKKKWLKFNNVFAIKEVIDDESFDDNQKVLKEVVELLHKYKIRYPRRQQHLSDFFERLLTTGLKQEVGQFFTPPPITKFIIKSLPVEREIKKTLNKPVAELPAVVDYAVGSGHFITEMLEEYQNIINKLDTGNFYPEVETKVTTWQNDQYSWASKYIYGIEKDYRLVKAAKVGCYFYGDGLAQIIHGDGLDNFKDSNSFRGLLKQKTVNRNNGKFSFVISNPPYSVSAFKPDLKNKTADKDFELYRYLTDRSSEIECLFVERTKQLLKDGGMAGIILPSSILSNSGIYTKTREIILQDFNIVAIAELGSNTFMATGTNTVVLFLQHRKSTFAEEIKEKVKISFADHKDVTINGIENPISKYAAHTWEGVSLQDYKTLLQKQPNEIIISNEIYQEYRKKIKGKSDEKWNKILQLEEEKLFYFILSYSQKVVLLKTGQKKEEKQFLGYEFSNRRGNEGIHPIQRGKSIDDCTSLFDSDISDNPEKASTYIYKAFHGDFDFPIHESLQKNIFRLNLVDMLTFDRVGFEKNISLSAKKKVILESKWNVVILSSVIEIIGGGTPSTKNPEYWNGNIPWLSVVDFNNRNRLVETTEKTITEKGLQNSSTKYLNAGDIIISARGTVGAMAQLKISMTFNQSCYGLRGKKGIDNTFLYYVLKSKIQQLKDASYGAVFGAITTKTFAEIKIPLPPKKIQETIVAEIEILEQKEKVISTNIDRLVVKVQLLFKQSKPAEEVRFSDVAVLDYGKPLHSNNRRPGKYLVMGSNGVIDTHDKFIIEAPCIIVGRKGSAGKINYVEKNCFPIDTTFYVTLDNQKANVKYFYYLLLGLNLEEIARGKGVGVPGLNRNDVHNIRIPLPSLKEQQKVVSEIETIESEITALQTTIKNIPQQKEAVLKKYL